MVFKYNPFSGKLDLTLSKADLTALLDDQYVNITGDTMTGDLTLPTLYATDAGFSEFNGGLIIKSGQKLIFDGAG